MLCYVITHGLKITDKIVLPFIIISMIIIMMMMMMKTITVKFRK